MSPARAPLPAISEAELIEIENRASALGVAAQIVGQRIAELEREEKAVPWTLCQAEVRLDALRQDVRRLIELTRAAGRV